MFRPLAPATLISLGVLLTLALSACRPAPAARATAQTAAPTSAPTPTEVAFSDERLAPTDLKAHFEAEGVQGAFVAYDPVRKRGWVHRSKLAHTAYLPASTFKIAHSIIALETGAVADAEEVIPWDGERRWHPQWNLDLNMQQALRVSAVPFYQEVARRVGRDRMQAWLNRLDYGNRNPGGELDLFWLTGALRISPVEQVKFLQRLRTGRLPIQAKTRDTVRKVLFFGSRGDHEIYAKTGSTDPERSPHHVNWFVGWVESPVGAVYFATLVLDPPTGKWSARMQVTDRILTALGVL